MRVQGRSTFMTADSGARTILPSGSMPKTTASRLSRKTLTFKSGASFAAIRPSSSGSGSQIAPASRLRVSSATHSRSLSASFKKTTNPAWSWDSAPRRSSCPGLRRPLLNGTRASSYYRARYYDQNAGRFLSEDPDDFSSGPNFYAYVSNHPTDFIDPSGRQKKKPKPPRPTQPPDTAYYICCKGGQFGVCDGPLARPSSFNNPIYNNMLLKCQKEHEQKHMDDFNSGKFLFYIQPSSCVGQPNNTPIGTNPAFKPNIECPAYAKQLDCLKQMESLMTPEINHVKDMQKQYHCPDCGK